MLFLLAYLFGAFSVVAAQLTVVAQFAMRAETDVEVAQVDLQSAFARFSTGLETLLSSLSLPVM